MEDRFLRYSLRHNRPVKALLVLDTLRYETLTVINLSDTELSYITARKKTPCTIPLSAVLAVGYARGDDGDSLENERRDIEKITNP